MRRWLGALPRWLLAILILVWAGLALMFYLDAEVMHRYPPLNWLAAIAFILPVVLIFDLLWLVWRRYRARRKGGLDA